MNYQNYHRHSFYSNVLVPDVTVTNEDYAIRAVELGQGIISGVEHGWQGRYIEGYELAKKYNLKFLFGTEAYIVKNRLEKDKINAHIILLAKNENGRRGINRILSESNLTGFYYRPRIDLSLLLSLPKNDVWITSACIGGLWKYEDADEIMLQIYEYFGNNFFLEVQAHNTDSQKQLNARIINLSNKNGIPIIFGCDTHYINPEQFKDRDDYLLSKHIEYEDEIGWYIDYPSVEQVVERFKEQGVLTNAQIKTAIENTNILLEVEEYSSPIFNKDLKLPSLYQDKTQDEKNTLLVNLVWNQWEIEKKNVDGRSWSKYEKEIQKELDVIIETKMADYFLLDYEVIARGKEIGGHITLTGRGSAPSNYLSKLLGFTTIDRIGSTVKLFPERFITKERILEAGSMPDIDFNLGNPEVFAQAQIDVLGDNHSYPMIAYGTLHPKAAWKLYARAKQVDFETANMISGQIDDYEMAFKHADEDEKEGINAIDYIDEEYKTMFSESSKYLGIVSDAKVHPCLTEETLILTKESGYKKIKDVVVGDSVITHTNNYCKVLKTMQRKVDEFYEVKIGGQKINATANHPFFVITNNISKNGEILSRSRPYWKNVEDLQKNDMVGFSINQESVIPTFEGIPTDCADWWWFVGQYIGNGYLSEFKRKNSYNRRINISCHIDKQASLVERLQRLNIQYHYANASGKSVEVCFYGQKYWKFLALFGKYASGKFLPNFVFDLPIPLLKSFLDGYLYADGNISGYEISYVTVSEKLAYGIQACVHKVYNSPCSIHTREPSFGEINGKKFKRLFTYAGRFAPKRIRSIHIFKDGYIWIRYNEKKLVSKETEVYNIEVEGDSSYTANNAIVHNCAHLLYNGEIREEIGILKVKENVVCIMDGLWAENYKMLKNDLLKVSVVDLIYKIYDRIGIQPHPLPDLIKICNKDKKTWDIYKNAWTIGINQVEQTSTKGRVAKYSPQNISELSAFVAAVRPGFQSNYKQFEAREQFSYGIESLDSLIQTEEFPQSYMLYQENAMQVMAYAGIPISQTYEIIKNIAKKRVEKVLKYKEQFVSGMTKKLMNSEKRDKEESEKIAGMTWQIIEDSSRYQFNASHSYSVAGDSLYGAYLKAHYPLYFYEVFMNIMEEGGDKDRLNEAKEEATRAFKINFPPYRFGQDNRYITAVPEKNEITSSISSIKSFSSSVGQNLYELGKNKYNNFIEFLVDAEEKGMFTTKFLDLIRINYFECFGNNRKLVTLFENFEKGEFKYSKTHTEKTKVKRLEGLLNLNETLPNDRLPLHMQLGYELEILGYVQAIYPEIDKKYLYVLKLDEKFAPRIQAYCLNNGNQASLKIQKRTFDNNNFLAGDVLYVDNFKKKPTVTFINGKYVESETDVTWWIDNYRIISQDKFNNLVSIKP